MSSSSHIHPPVWIDKLKITYTALPTSRLQPRDRHQGCCSEGSLLLLLGWRCQGMPARSLHPDASMHVRVQAPRGAGHIQLRTSAQRSIDRHLLLICLAENPGNPLGNGSREKGELSTESHQAGRAAIVPYVPAAKAPHYKRVNK